MNRTIIKTRLTAAIETARKDISDRLLVLATAVRGDEELQASWDMSELGYDRMAQSYEDEMLARAYEDEELAQELADDLGIVNPNAPF